MSAKWNTDITTIAIRGARRGRITAVSCENRDFPRGPPRFRVFSARAKERWYPHSNLRATREKYSSIARVRMVWHECVATDGANCESAVEREVAGRRASRLIASTLSRAKRKGKKKRKKGKTRPKWTIDDGSSSTEGRKYLSKDARYSPSSIEKNGNGRKSWITTAWRSLTASGDLNDLRSAHSNHYNRRRWSLVVAFARIIRSQPCLRDPVGLVQDRPIGENGAIFSNPCSKTIDL